MQCLGITSKGTRCQVTRGLKNGYCWRHQPQAGGAGAPVVAAPAVAAGAASVAAVGQCMGMTAKGVRCGVTRGLKNGYCWRHQPGGAVPKASAAGVKTPSKPRGIKMVKADLAALTGMIFSTGIQAFQVVKADSVSKVVVREIPQVVVRTVPSQQAGAPPVNVYKLNVNDATAPMTPRQMTAAPLFKVKRATDGMIYLVQGTQKDKNQVIAYPIENPNEEFSLSA